MEYTVLHHNEFNVIYINYISKYVNCRSQAIVTYIVASVHRDLHWLQESGVQPALMDGCWTSMPF